MFTGLIESVCEVKNCRLGQGDSVQLKIDLGSLAKDARIGSSIAINGVCLTVAGLQGRVATFDVSRETLAKSTLGKLKPASAVNAELAIKASDRFGGHFVLGHIDGTAKIKAVKNRGKFQDMEFTASAELLSQMIVKGSVAVDGISLTIAEINQSGFSIAVIPQTLEQTMLSKAKIGDTVNIETDIIVKVIKKQIENILPDEPELTIERLKELGF